MKRNLASRFLPFPLFALAAATLAFVGVLDRTALAGSAPKGRAPSAQAGCMVCIVGTPTVQWSGNSGSFHVDKIENHYPTLTERFTLDVSLASTYPTLSIPPPLWSGSFWAGIHSFSEVLSLDPLPPGGSHANIDSGTIRFDGSKVPAGEYWMVVLLGQEIAGGWDWMLEDYAVLADKVTCDGSGCTVMGTSPPFAHSVTRLLPVVIDVSNGSAHFTTEMALTNNTLGRLWVSTLYTASLGSKEGSGTTWDSLAPGEQKQISDVLSYLRERGLAIPSPEEQPSQGGTLLVSFQGNDTIDPRLVSVTARTAALTSEPHPVGRAGMAYSGLLETEVSTSSLTLFGLRSTPTDRTNVAVFNTSADPVTLKVTVHSGSGDGRSVVFREAETLPPYGWLQYGSARIFDGNGITTGWVTVERTSETGSFSAYAVINDSRTNDGSFVPPVRGAVAGSTLTVPVLTETPDFRSELILVNKSGSPVTLTLNYFESLSWEFSEGSMVVQLGPLEQQIIPEAIDFLRTNGVDMGPRADMPFSGALRITVSGTSAENVFAGARTASQSPAGGQFGLFTPCVYSSQETSSEAYLYGLRADSENRSNVAMVNTGTDSAGPILLALLAYDGDAGGVAKNYVAVMLSPGQWYQSEDFLRNSGVSNGWVTIRRMSGTAPWMAYGVVHDGGRPGERTGDGAYVPMVK